MRVALQRLNKLVPGSLVWPAGGQKVLGQSRWGVPRPGVFILPAAILLVAQCVIAYPDATQVSA